MNGKVCCFTGHRPEKLQIAEDQLCVMLREEIQKAVSDGFTSYLSGMAKGTDLIAAEIILQLRDAEPRLELTCVMPFEKFGQHWKGGWTERLQNVLAKANSICYVSERYSYAAFQKRNRWLVDHSTRVIAVYNGEQGGTKNTIDYAKKQGVPCIIIDARGQ